jgi:hypothetical protein
VRIDGKLALIIPLVQEKIYGIPALRFPGGKYLDKSAILYKNFDKEIIRETIEAITKLGNFYLEELSEELTGIITETNKNISKKESSISPYIPIEDNPFRYLTTFNRNKMMNRIKNNIDHLSYQTFYGDAQGLEVAYAVDRISRKMKKGQGTFVNEKEKQFFSALLKTYKKDFSIDVVYFDNNPIVYGIGLRYKNTYQALNTAYDDNYKYMQPGKTLLYYLLTRLKDEQVEIFDFSRGVNSLKTDFTPLSEKHHEAFYTKSFAARQWLITVKTQRENLLNNKTFYQTYCTVRKSLHHSLSFIL